MSQQSAEAGQTTSPPPAPPAGDLRRLLVLAFVVPAAHYILLGALPVSLDEDGAGATTIGTVIGTYAFAAGLARLALGRWVDIVPYRVSFAGSSVALLAASALYVLGDSITMLYLARAVHGVSLGVFYSVAYGWLGANTPTDQRGKWFGIVGALTGLALVSMPFAGLALYYGQGIDAAYLVFGLLAALSLPLALGGRPSSTTDGTAISLPLLATAGATLILSTACIGALEAFMPLLAADFSDARVAGLYVAFGAALVVGRVVGGLFGDRVGHGVLASVSMAAVATAMAAVLISSTYWVLAVAAILTALGIGGATTNIFASASAQTPAERQGRMLALLSLVGDVGTGSGAALAGAISGGARNGIVLFVVVTSLGAATTALRLGRPSGHRRVEVGVGS